MRHLLSLVVLTVCASMAYGQTIKPNNFTEETNPNNANFEFYSQKSDSTRRASFTNMKKNMVPDVNVTPIGFVPAATGNTLNKTQFVSTAGDSIYYIDGYGDAFLLYDPTDSVLTGSISGDTLYLNNLELLLSDYRQTIDTLAFDSGTSVLSVSLSGDNEAAQTIDLSSLGGGSSLSDGAGVSVAGDTVSLKSDTLWNAITWLTTNNFFRISPINTQTFFFSEDDRMYIGSANNKIIFKDTLLELSIDEIGGATGEFLIDDNRTVPKGLIYDGDYSATFVDRSLVDKEYADKDQLETEITAADTAVLYHILPVNSTSGAVTVTPPASPEAGNWFAVSDSRGQAGANNITIEFSAVAEPFHAGSGDDVISTNNGFARYTYINSTIGWVKSNTDGNGLIDSISYYGDTLRIYENGSATPFKVEVVGGSVGGTESIFKVENDTTNATSGTTNNYHTGRIGVGDFSSNTIAAGLHIYSATSPIIRLSDSTATDTSAMTYIDFYRGWNTTNLGRVGFSNALDPDLYLSNYLGGGRINFQTDALTKMSLYPSGQLHLPYYGDTTFTGMAVKYLAVTDDGAVIEADGSGASAPAVSSPTVSTTTTINFNGLDRGIFTIDLSSVTRTSLSLSNPVNGGEYTFWLKGASSDRVDFSTNFIDVNSTIIGERVIETPRLVRFFYDGSNYITDDTLGVALDPLSPLDVDSIYAWFRADTLVTDSLGGAIANNEGIGGWGDLSGNSRDLAQGTNGNRPVWKSSGLNGEPVGRFDGTNDFLASSATWWGSDSITIFVVATFADSTRNASEMMVAKNDPTASGRQWNLTGGNTANSYKLDFFADKDGGGANYINDRGGYKPNQWTIISYTGSVASGTIHMDGASKSVTRTVTGSGDGSIYNSSVSQLSLGAQNTLNTPNGHFNGGIAEVIIYAKPLSQPEREYIESYLQLRYGL